MSTFKSTNGDYNITVASGAGNLNVMGNIVVSTGNIYGNFSGNLAGATYASLSATGNIAGGNLLSQGDVFSIGTIVAGTDLAATGNVTANIAKTRAVAFSTLPSAATAGAGSRAFITDANTTTFGSQVTGGAGNSMPVYSNGTNWYVG